MNSLSTDAVSDLSELKPPSTHIALRGVPIVQARDANTFFTRLKGLHGLLPLAMDQALIIRPCNAIHTMTMPSAIDVLFVDGQGLVLRCETVKRRRFVRCADARAVVEMKKGAIAFFGISCGDQLKRKQGVWA